MDEGGGRLSEQRTRIAEDEDWRLRRMRSKGGVLGKG